MLLNSTCRLHHYKTVVVTYLPATVAHVCSQCYINDPHHCYVRGEFMVIMEVFEWYEVMGYGHNLVCDRI